MAKFYQKRHSGFTLRHKSIIRLNPLTGDVHKKIHTDTNIIYMETSTDFKM